MKAADLFGGWGGFTCGARAAKVKVVYAANHSPLAVRVHKMNHPEVEHVCQDLRQANWHALPPFGLLLAGPSCQPHSTASQPNRRGYHDEMRATAWSVVECADVTEPKAIIVENVVQFLEWRLYPAWAEALKALGYSVSHHVISATSHGVPQRRNRVFVVALRNGRQFVPPLTLTTEPSFEPCLETDADGWRPVAVAKPGARARLRAALARYDRCLVQHTTGHKGIPLHESIRTITTKDQWVLAERLDGGRYRPLTPRELARGMGFHDAYTWPAELARKEINRGLGNAVCPPVARDLITRVLEAA